MATGRRSTNTRLRKTLGPSDRASNLRNSVQRDHCQHRSFGLSLRLWENARAKVITVNRPPFTTSSAELSHWAHSTYWDKDKIREEGRILFFPGPCSPELEQLSTCTSSIFSFSLLYMLSNETPILI